MSLEAHYSTAGLLARIEQAITEAGLRTDAIDVETLASVDEFHIGGREATAALVDQLELSERDYVLDIGCGLGGTARFVASEYGCKVTGIDLTSEFVDTGNELCRWVGLENQISLVQGNALALPFEAEQFDSATMIHVGMNIEDKSMLFQQIYDVLRPGAQFAVYDIMSMTKGALAYPLPWASTPGMSHLSSRIAYKSALKKAGFEMHAERDRGAFAVDFYKRMKARMDTVDATPALGLHLLMGEETKHKVGNMIAGIQAGLIAPVEIVVGKSLKVSKSVGR
ncbi:MAG: class I SAM-dependent methyltransferase [Rhodothermales bacterium]